MRMTARSWPALALIALPVVVAGFQLGVVTALVLLVAILLFRWVLMLRAFAVAEGPELVLETISASHFAEKVRWCMDRLGVDYTEEADVGTLGAFYAGRTVPRLRIRTGAVTSSIGDSPAILRYLHGRYGRDAAADFLLADTELMELEHRIDRYGRWLQRWIYYHLLQDRALTLRIWGARDPSLPLWQRLAIVLLYPLNRLLMIRTFAISDAGYAQARERIGEFLHTLDTQLGDGRRDLAGRGTRTYVDFAFAALSGIWVWPARYSGGRADAVRPSFDELPEAMRRDITAWKNSYPRVTAFVERLYAEER